jgi:O-antigen/teichoic acid export membrane protein
MKQNNIKKLLFKSLLSFGSVQILNQLIQFFLLPLYTNKLSKEDYGNIEYVLILNTVFALIFSFQIHQSVMRILADLTDEVKVKKVISTCFWFVFVSFLFFTATLAIVHYYVGIRIYFDEKYESLFLIVLVTLFITGLNNYLNSIIIWSMQSVKSSLITALSIIINIGLTIYLVLFENYGIKGIVIAAFCAQFTILPLFILANLKKLGLYFDLQILKENLKFSTPLIFSSLAYYSWFFIDRFMINQFLGKDELGVFSVAVRFAAPIGLILGVLESALFPIVLNNYKNDETKLLLSNLLNIVMFGFGLFFLGIICFSPNFYNILVNAKFFYGHSLCFILCLGQFFSKIYFFNPGFAIEKKTTVFLTITVISSVINFGINYLLVPRMGILGAAIATGISAILYFILLFIYSNKFYKINFQLKEPILSFLLLIITYLLVLLSDYKYNIVLFIMVAALLVFINKNVFIKIKNLLSSKILAKN